MIRWVDQFIRHLSSGVPKAAFDMSKSYEEAVRALNTLQSNAASLEKILAERDRKRHMSIPDTITQAQRAGVTVNDGPKWPKSESQGGEDHLSDLVHCPQLDDIDKLSVIHVSGTKGKGSTCAFCESVIGAHGYKTGFFSSPHLVEVRERIRINGRPLSKDAFSAYFWDCYKNLEDTKEAHDGAMPAYFRFLTILAFHVFIQEKVDVAILEVGIGGKYDCTNIVRSPVVCGVSSLGLDHTNILGDTVDKIAWHKAGIFKPGVPAVTVPQPENSLDVLVDRAKEIGCPLTVSPPLESYDWSGRPMALGIPGKMQKGNASLAIQLCKTWLQNHSKSIEERKTLYGNYLQGGFGDGPNCTEAPHLKITEHIASGLKSCRWLGRYQTVKKKGLTYFIDGAHTQKSIELCAEWFSEASQNEAVQVSGKVVKILLFNTTGDRSPETLLQDLIPCRFDYAVFCPNIQSAIGATADQVNYTVTMKSQLARCSSNRNAWLNLLSQASKHSTSTVPNCLEKDVKVQCQADTDSGVDSGTNSKCSSTRSSPEGVPMPTFTFNTIQDAIIWVSQGRDPELPQGIETIGAPEALKNSAQIQVLCTGSIHLIGGILGMIDPSLSDI